MTWVWILLAALVAVAAARYRRRLDRRRSAGAPSVDDAAIRRIVDEGRIEADDDEPLDLDEIERQEAEFWNESWDEPEEYD